MKRDFAKMDIGHPSNDFDVVIEWLAENNYNLREESEQTFGDYSLILIYDSECVENAVFYRDLGYIIWYSDDFNEIMNHLGGIGCGGHYIAVGIFHLEKNITKEHSALSSWCPRGDDIIS